MINGSPTNLDTLQLKYGYAVLESQVRIAVAELGLDPTLGYLHICRPGRAALVYDLMEPYRPQIDKAILKVVTSRQFTPSDFAINSRGVCRLNPEFAKRLVSHAAVSIDGALCLRTLFEDLQSGKSVGIC